VGIEFIRFPTFERHSAKLFTEDDILELEVALALNPTAGDLIPGGRGLRKLRRPLRGHGKRGGARVIYYHVTAQGKILLIAAFAKNVQSDLSRDQLQQLSQIVKSEFP